VSFSTINYKTRNLRVYPSETQFSYSVKDKIKEIIYQWGQEHPWEPFRQKDALYMITYLETHLLDGIGHPDDPGLKGEMGCVSPDYKFSLRSNVPAVTRLTDEEYKKKMEQATIDLIQSFVDKRIFTTEEKIKNGEI
jgi:hypothetical protein